MAKTGLLIITNPKRISGILPGVLKHVKQTLYIHWKPTEINSLTNVNGLTWPKFSHAVGRMYYQASVHCESLDVRVLLSPIKYADRLITTTRKIDLLLLDEYHTEKDIDVIKQNIENLENECKTITILPDVNDETHDKDEETEVVGLTNEKVYESVVLGGTFDRLHNGHKILLTEALLRTNKKLTVGVTDTNMLLSKKLWELIEPNQVRIDHLNKYLTDVDPKIDSTVVSIQDPFGPTQHDPTFQMIVVSAETVAGGKKVNEIRCLNGLRTLDIHTVSLVGSGNFYEGEEEKISSSNYRMRVLGTRLKPIDLNKLKQQPYVIGLTGGISSGKSSIAKRFEQLGATLIDCDKIAHELYLPGGACYKLIIDNFGRGVIGDDGLVNRKALGAIVFNHKAQLDKLNQLIWPAIADETQARIDKARANGVKIVIVEAAVLLRAGWIHRYHEIWACIIPPEEAVKRLRERNGLSEDEARNRLLAQPSNADYVKAANVVFCTYWSHNFTQKQVELAWSNLNADLDSVK